MPDGLQQDELERHVFAELPELTSARAEAMRIEAPQRAFWQATNLLRVRHEDGSLPPDFPALIGMNEVSPLEREEMLQALRLHAGWYSSVMLAEG